MVKIACVARPLLGMEWHQARTHGGEWVLMINHQGPGLPSRWRRPRTPHSTWAGDPVSLGPRNPACGIDWGTLTPLPSNDTCFRNRIDKTYTIHSNLRTSSENWDMIFSVQVVAKVVSHVICDRPVTPLISVTSHIGIICNSCTDNKWWLKNRGLEWNLWSTTYCR